GHGVRTGRQSLLSGPFARHPVSAGRRSARRPSRPLLRFLRLRGRGLGRFLFRLLTLPTLHLGPLSVEPRLEDPASLLGVLPRGPPPDGTPVSTGSTAGPDQGAACSIGICASRTGRRSRPCG